MTGGVSWFEVFRSERLRAQVVCLEGSDSRSVQEYDREARLIGRVPISPFSTPRRRSRYFGTEDVTATSKRETSETAQALDEGFDDGAPHSEPMTRPDTPATRSAIDQLFTAPSTSLSRTES